ncbi:MAG: hypothetical protein JWO75_5658, partial [Actinomycetia bacterium]|nr:hypothetical protein [Actinomycetes bacterium]
RDRRLISDDPANAEGAPGTAQLHAGWADKLARAQGIPLASVAPVGLARRHR